MARDMSEVKRRQRKRRARDAQLSVATDERLKDEVTDLKRKEYETRLRELHVELVKLQEWVRHEAKKVSIVFEGRKGAGKGGAIKAITARVSPRIFRVVALPAPTDREKSQMYIQRYLPHLPSGGEVAIFDRSWYNRAGVERVMGFCTEEEVKHFLGTTPQVEKAMVQSGIILLKYWLEVSPEEQEKRLKARIDDGRKIWKLSKMDLKSFTRWDDYRAPRIIRRFDDFGLCLSERSTRSCGSVAAIGRVLRSPRHCGGILRYSTQTPPVNSTQAGAAATRSSQTIRRILYTKFIMPIFTRARAMPMVRTNLPPIAFS
jgi:polyphosphate kinase